LTKLTVITGHYDVKTKIIYSIINNVGTIHVLILFYLEIE